jgi:acyl-CoA thioester hydrolase
VRVRFQELDPLGVVWHGHYLAYLEDARHAFGRAFGFGYQDVRERGYVIPVVHAALDYHGPSRAGDELQVEARLHAEPGAAVHFTYEIRGEDGGLRARGHTVQVFTGPDGELCLTRPRFYEEFLGRWAGELRRP